MNYSKTKESVHETSGKQFKQMNETIENPKSFIVLKIPFKTQVFSSYRTSKTSKIDADHLSRH
jgi:hypothetical protein